MNEQDNLHDLAAEYALGTLSRDERADIARQRLTTPALDQEIHAWETKLAPLAQLIAGVAPSPDVFKKIERRLFNQNVTALPTQPIAGAKSWRGLALAASLFVLIIGGLLVYENEYRAGPQWLATVQKNNASPAFLVSFNPHRHELVVQPQGATPPADKDYELWIITKASPKPRSLGVIATKSYKLPFDLDKAALPDATLAVSVEPMGGSHTGAPTGPVVFTGKFVETAL